MFPVFEKEKFITFGMILCFLFSLFLRILIGAVYQNLLREVDNMATTNNKLLRQCKLKYTNCCKLHGGISNTGIFVERFLNRIAFGKLPLSVLYHLSGQMMLLSMVFSAVGVCRRILAGSMFGEILPFYIAGFSSLYLFFSLSSVLDIQGRKNALAINLTDYLENHLAARLDLTDGDMQRLYGVEYDRRKISRRDPIIDLIPIDRVSANVAIPGGAELTLEEINDLLEVFSGEE